MTFSGGINFTGSIRILVLAYSKNQPLAAAEMARVTKSGGLIAIGSDVNNRSEKELVTLTLSTAAKFIRSQLRSTPQNLAAKQWIANELQAKRRT